MKLGDLVWWSEVQKHDYLNLNSTHLGVFIKELEIYDHWVLAEVINDVGQISVVMLQKNNFI